MADIQCEKFKPRSWVLNTPMLTWSATLSANPGAGWKRALDEAVATQAAAGGSTGAPLRTLPFQGHTILEFDSPENTAEATVNQIHRAIEKANKVTAEQRAELKKHADAEKKKHDEAQGELERLKSKYKDGI